jgi:hypothetical protein
MTKGEKLGELSNSTERAAKVGLFILKDYLVEPLARALPPRMGSLLSSSVRLKEEAKTWVETRLGRENLTNF